MVNLSTGIKWHAIRTPDRLALVYGSERITYSNFFERILGVAAFLKSKGVAENDVVAVFMKNSAAFFEIVYATSHLGAVFLPINFRLARDEAEYILNDAGARILLADEEFAGIVDNIPGIETVLVNEYAQQDGRHLSGNQLPVPGITPRKSGDLLRLMYTSGTTDRPKGVMHTYENFCWKSLTFAVALGIRADDRNLIVGPMYHIGGFDAPGATLLWMGGMVYIERDFNPENILKAIERERLTCGWMAPVMLGRVLAFEGRDKYDVSSFKWCIGGGEKTPESRIRAFTEYFTNGRYIDAYGLTESYGCDTMMEPGMEIVKIGSAGRAIPNVEIQIRDDAANELPPGAVGEICLRGPKVTKGYWKNPELNAVSFFGEWLRTGDVGYLDEDGFIYLTDRKKDMIISGAENVASSEVERVIYLMPEVAEVSVIGIPDEKWGELVTAVVVPRDGETVDYPMIERHCRKYLAGFKVPRKIIIRDSLPRNPSGKILKRILRDEYCKC